MLTVTVKKFDKQVCFYDDGEKNIIGNLYKMVINNGIAWTSVDTLRYLGITYYLSNEDSIQLSNVIRAGYKAPDFELADINDNKTYNSNFP